MALDSEPGGQSCAKSAMLLHLKFETNQLRAARIFSSRRNSNNFRTRFTSSYVAVDMTFRVTEKRSTENSRFRRAHEVDASDRERDLFPHRGRSNPLAGAAHGPGAGDSQSRAIDRDVPDSSDGFPGVPVGTGSGWAVPCGGAKHRQRLRFRGGRDAERKTGADRRG